MEKRLIWLAEIIDQNGDGLSCCRVHKNQRKKEQRHC